MPNPYINKRQAPRMIAAVPVHTPLCKCQLEYIQAGQKRARRDSHQPLKRTELDPLDPLPQPRHLLLDAGLRLLDLQLLHVRLLADPALLEVQVEAHAGLGAGDLVAQAAVELGQVVGEALVGGAGELALAGVGPLQLGAQAGEVDLLGVGGALGVLARHHGARQVLDRLLHHVGQHPHHGHRLLLAEPLVPQPLHELERVEVVVAPPRRRRGEGARGVRAWVGGRAGGRWLDAVEEGGVHGTSNLRARAGRRAEDAWGCWGVWR